MKRLCLQRTPDSTPTTRKLRLITQDHSIKRLLASSTEEVLMAKINSTLPRFVLVLGASCLLIAGMAFSQDTDDTNKNDETSIQKRVIASAHVLDEIMGTPDKAIPD